MGWVRLDSDFFEHPKVLQVSTPAKLLFLAGLCYSHRHSTDGQIPKQALQFLTVYAAAKPRHAVELVDAGLWHKLAAGWEIHDYLHYQESAEDDRIRREARSAAGRRGAEVRWGGRGTDSKTDSKSHSESDGKPIAKPMANEWQTDGTSTSTEVSTSVVSPPFARGGPEATKKSRGSKPPANGKPDPLVERILAHLGDNPKQRRAAMAIVANARPHLAGHDIDEAIGAAIENDARSVAYFDKTIRDVAGRYGITIPPLPKEAA